MEHGVTLLQCNGGETWRTSSSGWARRAARGRGCSLCSGWPGRTSSSQPPRPTIPRRPTLDLGLSTPWPSPPLSRRHPPATRSLSHPRVLHGSVGDRILFPQAWRGWGLLSGTSLGLWRSLHGGRSQEHQEHHHPRSWGLVTSYQCTAILQ